MNNSEKKVIALSTAHMVLFTGPAIPAAAVAMILPIILIRAQKAIKGGVR